MSEQIKTALTILRRRQVEQRTGLSRSGIYQKLVLNPKRPSYFDSTFPKPISLGGRSVGWVEREVDAWIEQQIEKSRSTGGGAV